MAMWPLPTFLGLLKGTKRRFGRNLLVARANPDSLVNVGKNNLGLSTTTAV